MFDAKIFLTFECVASNSLVFTMPRPYSLSFSCFTYYFIAVINAVISSFSLYFLKYFEYFYFNALISVFSLYFLKYSEYFYLNALISGFSLFFLKYSKYFLIFLLRQSAKLAAWTWAGRRNKTNSGHFDQLSVIETFYTTKSCQ